MTLLSLLQSTNLRQGLWPDKVVCCSFMAQWAVEDGSRLLCVCPGRLTRCVTRPLHNYKACMTTLSVSLTDSLLLQLTKFMSVLLQPWCLFSPFLSFWLSPPCFSPLFLTLSACHPFSPPPPCTFFVSSNSSVAMLANISLQLAWDWAHLFFWFTEHCVLCFMCVYISCGSTCVLRGSRHALNPLRKSGKYLKSMVINKKK